MFTNIGKKIQKLAQILFWIIIGFLALMLLALLASGADAVSVVTAVLTLLLSGVLAWAGSFCLYGFGELIEKVSSIEQKMKGTSDSDKLV